MAVGCRVLSDALALAEQEDVSATAELLEGHPARRVVEFARLRDARLIVLGSRRRPVGNSVSRRVIRLADRPVVVAGRAAAAAA
jgi:nucleotide-binding universal stress UspA family protein